MTYAAILSLNNRGHRNRVAALLRQKDCRVAIQTGQPLGVRPVRKSHIGHRTGIGENNVEVGDEHFFVAPQTLARIDDALIQHLHPVDDSLPVTRESFHGVDRLLQHIHRVIGGIVDPILGNRNHFTFELKVPAK